MKYVCQVCGYVYEGSAPPEKCPVCGVGADKFKAVEGEMKLAAEHEYGIYAKIMIPMSEPALSTLVIFTFVNTWNELLVAMVFISDPEKRTLPVTLTYFVGPYATNYVQMFAAIVIAVIPTIVVYSIFSNQIVEGLTAGAVKG